MGAVIAQDNRPIAFFSRKLSEMQQKYSVTKIELLAIVETLKESKEMLWGQDIKVYTDQKSHKRCPRPYLQQSIPLAAWLVIPIFGFDFWDPHRKQNSDSVLDSGDSGRFFF